VAGVLVAARHIRFDLHALAVSALLFDDVPSQTRPSTLDGGTFRGSALDWGPNMKGTIATAVCATLMLGSVPAYADFKYTETTQMTGGSLMSMMKAVSMFSKQASKSTQPTTTTHAVKGNRLRTENADGKIQIIDLEGRRFIEIDPQKKTYSEMTFDEMKAAMDRAMERVQQQPQPQSKPQDSKPQDAKATVNAKVNVTPGTATWKILGQTANEMKVQIDMEVTAQPTNDGQASAPANAQASGQPAGPVSGTISTTVDTWVAPDVPGYKELGEFYMRMGKETNWVPPASTHVDPRVSESLGELQKNQSTLRGLPLLEYVTTSMVLPPGSTTDAQNLNGSTSSASGPTSNNPPTSASDAMMKGLGGMFGGRKKKNDAATDANSQSSPNSQNPPPPPSTPGSLMEMTMQVTSFSDTELDASIFEVPAGYARVASPFAQSQTTK
jgi:hypothetical protein